MDRPDPFAAARAAALKMAETKLERTQIGAAIALFIDTLHETHEVVPRYLFEAIVDDSAAYRKTLITDADREWAMSVAKQHCETPPAAPDPSGPRTGERG